MPIYSYKCEKCEHYAEEFRTMSDMEDEKLLMKCPSCGKKKYHRFMGVIPNIDSGPLTFGTMSEQNIKKYGKPKEMIDFENKKKHMTPFEKRVEKLQKATPQERNEYVSTGKLNGKDCDI